MQHEPQANLLFPSFLTLDGLDSFLDSDGFIDWGKLFGNSNPVEIDAGCGRGMFVVNSSIAKSEINYLGIEIDYREGRHGAKRLKKREMPNARILGGDVRFAFDKYVRPGSVSVVHVYFPDPWWKRRHRRRRVFTDQLVEQFTRILQPDGFVHSWTDVEDYFEVISALMNHDKRFRKLPVSEETVAEHDLDYQTSFDRKKRQAGCPIYRGQWQFLSGD